MTTTSSFVDTESGERELARLARTAMDGLGADGLIVVDERSPRPRLVARAGNGASLPVDVERVLSAPLEVEEGRSIGTMHVLYADVAAATQVDSRFALVRAFARHVGIALAYGELPRERDAHDAVAEALTALEDVARSPRAVDRMTAAVTDVVRPLTGATAAGVLVWDEERDILRALPGAFGSTDRALPASVTGPTTNLRSSAARVFTTGRPYVTNNAAEDPGALSEYIEELRIRRALWYPLSDEGAPVGVLILANKPTDFTLHDIALLEGPSRRIARAVEIGRSMTRIRAQRQLEAILSATAQAIAEGKSMEECLRPAFERLRAVTHASVVALVPKEGPPLVSQAGLLDAHLETRFMRDARALVYRSTGALPRSPGDPGWAALHVPVELYGGRTAALSLLRRNGEPFRRDEAAMISRVANLAALAWATERHQHQRAELARRRERERIANELHDRVAQILFAAQLGLDSILEDSAGSDIDEQRVIEVRALLTKGDTAIRSAIHQLATPSEASTARRIRDEVDTVAEEFGAHVHVEVAEDQLNGVPRPVADCLIKVAREALVNAAKHAGTCRISLHAGAPAGGPVQLTVLDDGVGLTEDRTTNGRYGLVSLRRSVEDAGGSLEVTGAGTGSGTRVTASFPG